MSVHIDTLPAMTGATRFFERARPWVYSKVRYGYTQYSLHAGASWRGRVLLHSKGC